jgi:hypothetical protein
MNKVKTVFITAVNFAMIAGLLTYASCKKKTPAPDPNEEELITTIQLTFIDSAGSKPLVTAIYKDLDGDGGNNPSSWDTIKLQSNTTYYASINLYNESTSPTDTITNEILEEDDEHLFCYTSTNSNIQVNRTDSDGTYEVGLQSKWKVTNVGIGIMNIVLKHQPDGIKNGTCGVGSSDIDLNFQTEVK